MAAIHWGISNTTVMVRSSIWGILKMHECELHSSNFPQKSGMVSEFRQFLERVNMARNTPFIAQKNAIEWYIKIK